MCQTFQMHKLQSRFSSLCSLMHKLDEASDPQELCERIEFYWFKNNRMSRLKTLLLLLIMSGVLSYDCKCKLMGNPLQMYFQSSKYYNSSESFVPWPLVKGWRTKKFTWIWNCLNATCRFWLVFFSAVIRVVMQSFAWWL